MMQVKNSIIQAWDQAFVTAVTGNVGVNTLVRVQRLVGAVDRHPQRHPVGREAGRDRRDAQGALFGFEADTLIVNKTTKYDLLRSNQFQTPYVGDIASENLKYTGKLPQKLLNYDVVTVPTNVLANGTAILMQRNVAGFIADEVPLNATALYRDEPRKIWRSDVQRVSAVGLDQPKAACIITGV
jgi:hypothetical protein